MKNQTINEAIANISITSKAIEKYCNDPENHCSPTYSSMLEIFSRELGMQAEDLQEIQYLYGE